MLKIDCIWCKTRSEFDRYVKSENYDLVISYSDIYGRLLKSDPYGNEPSDVIISLYIEKMLRTLFEDEKCCKGQRLVYLLKNLDQETISNFKEFVSSMTDESYEVGLTIINRCDYPKKGVLSKFDNVRFIDND